MGRKSLAEGQKRPANFDEFTLDFDEAAGFYAMVGEAVRNADVEIEVVVKPHPSSSEPANRTMLDQVGLGNCTISYDSFYDMLPTVDIVVSQFTTALSIPIAYGIPTIVLETKLQHYVHARWPLLGEYYLNLKYYVRPAEFSEVFTKLVHTEKDERATLADRELLFNFYDDSALENAVSRVGLLLQDK